MFYAPGLLGYSAVKIASPTFYSLKDSRTPVIVSVLSVAANLALNLWLVQVLSFRGLALGTAIAAVLNAVILLALLSQRLGGLDGRRLAISATKISVASALMGAAVWFGAAWLETAVPGSALSIRAIRVFTSIAAGVIVLIIAARALRIEELDDALRRLARRAVRS
jgi:putative peptidoglycan lipid II flippase